MCHENFKKTMFSKGTKVMTIIDSYTIKARFAPALFNLFPSILFLSLVLNKLNLNLNMVLGSTLFSSLVLPIFFSEMCRIYGKILEKRNYEKWGGKPTTILLRSSDNSFDNATKKKLYAFIYNDFGIDLGTDNSDENINNAKDRIISYFHKNKDELLTKHKIEYDFTRNLAGSNNFFILESLLFSVALGTYYIIKGDEITSLEDVILLLTFPTLFIVSYYLEKYVYPELVKDRAFIYAKTLINSYYRESNNLKKQ